MFTCKVYGYSYNFIYLPNVHAQVSMCNYRQCTQVNLLVYSAILLPSKVHIVSMYPRSGRICATTFPSFRVAADPAKPLPQSPPPHRRLSRRGFVRSSALRLLRTWRRCCGACKSRARRRTGSGTAVRLPPSAYIPSTTRVCTPRTGM